MPRRCRAHPGHELSPAWGYQTALLTRYATAQHTVDLAAWTVRLAPYAGDGASDLFLVGSTNGTVEVHVLSAASGYQQYLPNDASPLGTSASGWTYLIAHAAGSGDLVGVDYGGATGSGKVHILSRASG